MYLTLEECRSAWENAVGQDDKAARINRNIKWMAYYRYLADQQLGRQPDIRNYAMQAEYSISVEEACRRNEIYFEIFGIPMEKSRPVLKQYFEAEAENGFVPDVTKLNTAMITWKVSGAV